MPYSYILCILYIISCYYQLFITHIFSLIIDFMYVYKIIYYFVSNADIKQFNKK